MDLQHRKTEELREQLRKALFSLASEFGLTLPVKCEDDGKSRSMGATDFSGCYPDLQVLCHYTDPGGLEGILKSGMFWATNVAYLNDPHEFRFAFRVLEDMIRRGEHALDERLVGTFLEGLRTGGHDREMSRTYMISFSSRQDDLSQFRAYSDNARGYALEFEPHKLVAAVNSFLKHESGEYLTLRRVRYGVEELAQFHVRAINELKNCIDRSPHSPESTEYLEDVRAFGMDFSEYLREAGVVFKQEGYRDEDEYRLVLDVSGLLILPTDIDSRINVRFRGGLPVPYIPFQFLPEVETIGGLVERENHAGINRVVVGPGQDFQRAGSGLFYLLRQSGLVHVPIEPSRCSYRAL